ncbi:MAG: peptidyl-prolyl cis-trans isomerase, partial [Puniceicoccaceae bacterium]|nr:peptidyl-prolyl cis-trans isomerase [Puniceicoccaceae bacterium]
MISWIQNRLIRHGRWIFITLLGVIIVAFVFTIGNTPGCTTNDSAYEVVNFYGYDLNSPKQMQDLGRKASLSAQVNNVRIENNQQFQSQLMVRIALLHLAEEIGIPIPTAEALSDYIQTKPLFADEEGDFSRDAMTRFMDSIQSDPSIPDGLVATVLQEDYQIDALTKALSGPGYTLPSEGILQTQRNRTSYTVTTAQLSYQEFSPEIDLDANTLEKFYQNNAANYEIPERIKASILFFLADEDKNKDSESSEVKEQANRSANQAAQNFAYDLYNRAIDRDSSTFKELVTGAGLKLTTIEPYTLNQIADRELPEDLLNSAFALSDAKYYSDPYPINGGYAVLIYEGRVAPELPAFDSVAEQVKDDFIIEEKRRLFYAEGLRIKDDLDEALQSGAKFSTAAEGLQLEVESYEAFMLSEVPESLNQAVVQAIPSI